LKVSAKVLYRFSWQSSIPLDSLVWGPVPLGTLALGANTYEHAIDSLARGLELSTVFLAALYLLIVFLGILYLLTALLEVF
jgi:hypothetical protein